MYWVIIGSVNGLWPIRHQAITWTNATLLSIESLGTNFNEICTGILPFSFKKCNWKCRLPKWLPFCPEGLVNQQIKRWVYMSKWIVYRIAVIMECERMSLFKRNKKHIYLFVSSGYANETPGHKTHKRYWGKNVSNRSHVHSSINETGRFSIKWASVECTRKRVQIQVQLFHFPNRNTIFSHRTQFVCSLFLGGGRTGKLP